MAEVTLSRLCKSFGAIDAVCDVSLEIADREFVVFVGPSGCGKSTLLRMIAGLEEITSGSLRIGGKEMNDVPAADRGIAMVFQSYALYPHMNVRENIGFGLRMAGMARDAVAARVAEAAAVLQIEDLLDRRPRELSGGQRQRVAIGRAIVKSPGVFLFDEPLSNLDADLRAQMRVEIARLHEALNATIVYVTHDQVEAMTLADRIVVLRDGRIEQQGKPEDLYDRPANLFVAGFIGQPRINLLGATLRRSGGAPHIDVPPFGAVAASAASAAAPDGSALTIGLRADAVSLDPRPEDAQACGRVELVENLGNEVLVHVRLPDTGGTLITTMQRSRAPRPNREVRVGFDPATMHVFDAAGERITDRPTTATG